MKQIHIAEQPWLGLGRTMRITADGIRYRLFRASVTVAVIAVAVAFLMNVLGESLIKRAVGRDTRERIAQMRLVYDWSARLTNPGSNESILTDLAECDPGTDRYREMQGLGRFSDTSMEAFHRDACQAVRYIDFFGDLDYAKRRSAIHTARGIGIFERLRTEKGMKEFRTAIAQIRSVRFVTSYEELEQFLSRTPQLLDAAAAVLTNRRAAIAQVATALAGRSVLEALAQADGDFGEVVRRAGFILDAQSEAPVVADQAERLLDVIRLEKTMDSEKCRQLLAQQGNVMPADVNVMMMWKYLDGSRFSARYLARMEESGLDTGGLSPERLVSLAEARKENADLLRAERLTSDAGRGFMGLGERLAWLLFVSLLVCGIGICNAMLMTVTERFTEIATLKCLGALDGFIMLMFVMESSILGIVGGCIGAVLGALIALGRMLVAFGIHFIGAMPATELLIGMGASVAMGMFLAAIAAVLPSYQAARLAPMEAMRIE
jgi:putative ABC transport system permease protein